VSTTVHQAIAELPLPPGWRWRVDVRPRRRSLGIEITHDGEVRFAVPADADPQAVAAAVRTRLPRLAEEIRRRADRPVEPVKELVGGSSFAYLGRRYRLKPVPADRERRVRLHRGWLELPESSSTDEGARRIAAWYTERGSEWLRARVSSLELRVGAAARRVEVADLAERWGACAPSGVITVHWAVIQLPPPLVDLVLVHELCHLKVSGHGPGFRREMRLVLSDADRRERWFAEEEPLLWRGRVT
jgi:predicted metal-dependent hydrolase